MNRPIFATRSALATCASAMLLSGCSAGTHGLPPVSLTQQWQHKGRAPNERQLAITIGYIYVSDRTHSGASELLVYEAGVRDPAPLATITNGLSDVRGVAIDDSGDAYVANGSGGDVLEFSPGGASLKEVYSKGLVHPNDVTVAGNTLYVTDSGDSRNGYAQQVFEYTLGNPTPELAIAGIGTPGQLNEGIAMAASGYFYVSATSMTAVPPSNCPGDGSFTVAQDASPTLWVYVPLSHNGQASGIAFDSHGKLYVADICANDVAIYSEVGYTWTYSGMVSGTFETPLLLTINGDLLAIPSYGSKDTNGAGDVSVIDLNARMRNVTITKGLDHPVGAAVYSQNRGTQK